MKKYIAVLPFIVYIAILLVPAVDRKFHFLPVYQETEKRDLAPRPQYSVRRPVPDMMREFDAYWKDNFGGRNFLLHLRALIWIKIFRMSPVESVVIGQKGNLFYRSEAKNDGPGIDDYQGKTPLTENELQSIVGSVEKVNKDLQDKDITLIVLVAPNKSTVYGDQLPLAMQKRMGTTRMDQLVAHLPSDIHRVDVRSLLRDSRQTMPTYLETDSHWNAYGAYLAAGEVARQFPPKFHVSYPDLKDIDVQIKQVQGEGDLASMMAARGVFDETDIYFPPVAVKGMTDYNVETDQSLFAVHVWEQTNAKLPRLTLFGDSFRTGLTPFLVSYFSKTCVIGYSTTFKINYELMDTCHPDIVIWEIAERYIDRLDQNLYIHI